MHRLLILGSTNFYSLANQSARSLQRLGQDVWGLDPRHYIPDPTSFKGKVLVALLGEEKKGRSEFNKAILDKVQSFKPDFVLDFCEEVEVSTLNQLRNGGALIYCVFPKNDLNPSKLKQYDGVFWSYSSSDPNRLSLDLDLPHDAPYTGPNSESDSRFDAAMRRLLERIPLNKV